MGAVSLLRHPRLPVFAAALGMLLCLPSIGTGLHLDDRLQQAAFDGQLGRAVPPWDLFNFVPGGPEVYRHLVEHGVLGWWADPELRISFGRPLASLSHALDLSLFASSPWLMHAENLLLYGLLCVVAGSLFRRLFGAGRVAGLATLLYALDQGHGTAVGWLAARNALLVALFGMLSLNAHLRWRKERWIPGAALSAIFLAFALESGESGLTTGGYLVAFALLLDRSPWRQRLLSLLPAAGVLTAWLILYRLMGFGFHGGGLYTDPIADPQGYLLSLLTNLPVYLAGQLFSVPTDGSVLMPRLALGLALFWALCVGTLLLALRPILLEQPRSRFLLLGFVLSLLPVGAAFPQDRHLLLAGLGGIGLLGLLIDRALLSPELPSLGRPLRGLALALLVVHGLVSPLLLPLRSLSSALIEGMVARASRSLPPSSSDLTVILVKTPLEVLTWSAALPRDSRGEPRKLHVLSSGMDPASLEVVDERTVRLRLDQGWGAAPVNLLFRGGPFEEHEEVDLGLYKARVERLNDSARPMSVLFTFDRAIDDPSLVWATTCGGLFETITPGRPGETIQIP